MAPTAVTLNALQGHSQVAGLFKWNPSNIYAAFYTSSTDTVPAVPLRLLNFPYESGDYIQTREQFMLETRTVENNETRKVFFVNLRPLNT